MRITPFMLLVAVAAVLAGCNEAEHQSSAENSWLVFRTSRRACGGSKGVPRQPGRTRKTPDCINANEARKKITVQEMKDALK